MQLLHLSLENWSCHDSLAVDLSKSLQVEGRNGTGKSSVLEALRFIFIEQSRGYKGKIKNGKDFAKVKLMLKKDRDTFVIEKILSRDKTAKARMFKNTIPVADNLSSVHAQLKDILSEEILEKLLYIPQGKLTEVLDSLRIKGGRQELDSLLGLDKFEKIYKSAGEELIKKKEHLASFEDQIKKFPENAEELFERELKAFKENDSEIKGKIRKLESEKEILNRTLNELKAKAAEMEKTKKTKDELERKLNELQLKIVKLTEELNAEEKNSQLLREKKAEFENLKSEAEKLKNCEAVREILTEKKNLEERMKDLLVAEDKDKIQFLENELGNLDEVQTACSKKEKEVLELEREFAVQKEKLLEKMNFLRDLDQLRKEKQCPRCGQALSIDHIEREKEETSKEIFTAKDKGAEIEKKLNVEKGILEQHRIKVESFSKKAIELKTLKEQISKKNIERQSSEKKREELDKQLTSIGYKNETIHAIELRVNKLNNLQGRMNELQRDAERAIEIEKKIPRLNAELSQLDREKFSAEERMKMLSYDETALKELNEKRDGLQENSYRLQNEIQGYNFKLKEYEMNIEKLETEKKEFSELKEKERNSSKELHLLEKARELFHTDKGIPKYLREKYITKLNFLLSTYFQKLNQNPTYQEVHFNKEYELEVKTNEGMLNLEQISGGEKAQLAIAFRLSLIDLLSPIRLLILDEPFGSLDQEHREILGTSMSKIAKDGQVILVTHVPVESLQLPERLDLGGY